MSLDQDGRCAWAAGSPALELAAVQLVADGLPVTMDAMAARSQRWEWSTVSGPWQPSPSLEEGKPRVGPDGPSPGRVASRCEPHARSDSLFAEPRG